MRLFLAIPISAEIRESLKGMQARLKTAEGDVRWVDEESLHLTVAFLGDLNDSLLPDIEFVCSGLVSGISPFRMEVRGGSAFPKRGPNLKTLWAGVTAGADEWKSLALRAHKELRAFGVPGSGELVPHVTLGRVKTERNMPALREALADEAETDCGEQTADRLLLVQTFLAPSGATYRDVGTWRFTADTTTAESTDTKSNESLTSE